MNTSSSTPVQPGHTEAEETAALVAIEQQALSQGIILEGVKDPFGGGYLVQARRADTGASLNLSFGVTLRMATHLAVMTEALTELLADAIGALAPRWNSRSLCVNRHTESLPCGLNLSAKGDPSWKYSIPSTVPTRPPSATA